MSINLEKLDKLPHKESKKDALARHDRWRGRKSDCHRVDGEFPWKHVERVLKAHIGKPFDDAFSAYCKIVPKYQQKWFLEEFDDATRVYMSWYEMWYVDKNGNIQLTKRKVTKEKPSICSDDYEVELRHKITGHKKDDFEADTKVKKITRYYYKYTTKYVWGIRWNKLLPKHEQYTAKADDFVPVVVRGWIKYFKSKQDKEFKRLMAEKIKKAKRTHKETWNKNKNAMSDVEYRLILKAKVIKEREIAKQKLEAKGMRPDAFTNHTQ